MKDNATMIENGERFIPIVYHKCIGCGKTLIPGSPNECINNEYYCGDCAYLHGYITEYKLLRDHYYFIDGENLRAMIRDNQVIVSVDA